MKWDTTKIVNDLGGPVDLAAKLRAKTSNNITPSTIRQWVQRDSIPSAWLAAILLMEGMNPNEWISEDIF